MIPALDHEDHFKMWVVMYALAFSIAQYSLACCYYGKTWVKL